MPKSSSKSSHSKSDSKSDSKSGSRTEKSDLKTNPKSDSEEELDINVIDCADFKIENFSVPPIDEKHSSDAQYHAFPTYKYDNNKDKLTLKTGPIKITKGGIPRLNANYCKTDSKREFMWLGKDDEQQSCKELFDVFEAIDNHFDKLISYDTDEKTDPNLESKIVSFQKDKKKLEPLSILEYTPLVRDSVQGGDGETKPDQPEYVPYKRCKLRFAKKYDKEKKEGDPSELTTTLFVGDKEEAEDLKYPSDFEKILRWNCTAKFMLQISKFRCKKSVEKDKKGKPLPRNCAFDINILQIVIVEEAPKSGTSNAEKYRRRMFPTGKLTTEVTEKRTKTVESSSESDSSDSSNSEDDESGNENKNQSKKKTEEKSDKKTSSKKVVSSESESGSESGSGSDSEDSESESESEESDAEAKAKAKAKAKTSKK